MKTTAPIRHAAALLLGLAAAAPAPAPATTAAPQAAPQATSAARPAGTPVPLRSQPNTWMDAAARRLVVQDTAEARQAGEIPLVMVGAAKLSTGPQARESLFVQLQSPRECGSAGCSTQVFVWQSGRWARVLDGVSGVLRVAPQRTKGMADLLSDEDHFRWTGTAYRSIRPAPAVDLRPKRGL